MVEDCPIPDFSNIAGIEIKQKTMEISFAANKVSELTDILNVASINRIDQL